MPLPDGMKAKRSDKTQNQGSATSWTEISRLQREHDRGEVDHRAADNKLIGGAGNPSQQHLTIAPQKKLICSLPQILTCQTAHCRRHEAGRLLVASYNELHGGLAADRLHKVEVLFSRHAEHPLDALILQGMDEHVRSLEQLSWQRQRSRYLLRGRLLLLIDAQDMANDCSDIASIARQRGISMKGDAEVCQEGIANRATGSGTGIKIPVDMSFPSQHTAKAWKRHWTTNPTLPAQSCTSTLARVKPMACAGKLSERQSGRHATVSNAACRTINHSQCHPTVQALHKAHRSNTSAPRFLRPWPSQTECHTAVPPVDGDEELNLCWDRSPDLAAGIEKIPSPPKAGTLRQRCRLMPQGTQPAKRRS